MGSVARQPPLAEQEGAGGPQHEPQQEARPAAAGGDRAVAQGDRVVGAARDRVAGVRRARVQVVAVERPARVAGPGAVAGVARRAGVPVVDLRVLDLSLAEIGDPAVRALAKMKSIRHLELTWTYISDEACASIAKIERIKTLSLALTDITDACVASLTKLGALEALQIDYTKVSDEGLRLLASIESLRSLSLADTHITLGGLTEFSNLRPDVELSTLSGGPDPRGVPGADPRIPPPPPPPPSSNLVYDFTVYSDLPPEHRFSTPPANIGIQVSRGAWKRNATLAVIERLQGDGAHLIRSVVLQVDSVGTNLERSRNHLFGSDPGSVDFRALRSDRAEFVVRVNSDDGEPYVFTFSLERLTPYRDEWDKLVTTLRHCSALLAGLPPGFTFGFVPKTKVLNTFTGRGVGGPLGGLGLNAYCEVPGDA